jgi:hypothetical protein
VPASTIALLASAVLVLAAGAIVSNTLQGTVNVTGAPLALTIASNSTMLLNGGAMNANTNVSYDVTVHVLNTATVPVSFVFLWTFTGTGVQAGQVLLNRSGIPVPLVSSSSTSLAFQTGQFTIAASGAADYSFELEFKAAHSWSWSIAAYAA